MVPINKNRMLRGEREMRGSSPCRPPWSRHQRLRPLQLAFRPYDPDADKNSVSDPNEASPLLYPTPKAMPTHPGRGQRNRPKPFSQYAESFSLPDDIRLRRTFKRRQTTFLNFWFLSIFQVFLNNTGHKEFDFRDKHIRCDTQSARCSYLT